MANDDWRSKLGALMENMPADETAERPSAEPSAEPGQSSQSGRLDIILERKGRGGKTATIVTGFTLPDDEVATLASAMKQRLGTGGSARGGEILIQGDRRSDVLRFLTDRGFKARII